MIMSKFIYKNQNIIKEVSFLSVSINNESIELIYKSEGKIIQDILNVNDTIEIEVSSDIYTEKSKKTTQKVSLLKNKNLGIILDLNGEKIYGNIERQGDISDVGFIMAIDNNKKPSLDFGGVNFYKNGEIITSHKWFFSSLADKDKLIINFQETNKISESIL